MASNDSHREAMSEDSGQETEEEVETQPSHGNKGKRKGKGIGGSARGVRKKTRSLVWEHYRRQEKDYDRCNCRHCGKDMSCLTASGTSNLRKHLQVCKGHAAWQAAKAFSEQENQTELNQDQEGNLCFGKVSEAVFHEATNELIVLAELPLAFSECLGWRHFCKKMKLDNPQSRRTCTREIVKMYADRKATMKKIFGENKHRLSLTTDIWVAPFTKASYMVITAHFIDVNWKLKKMIIGFKNVPDHKGSTISKVLLECLSEWDIKKIFSITVDNATANTSAMRKFKEGFILQHGDEALVLKGDFLHLRCSTHLISI